MRKQDNWKDCGVFIISYFRHFLESPISYPYTINSFKTWVKDFNEKIATKEQRTDLRKILFKLYNEKHPGDEIPDEVDNIEEYKRMKKQEKEKEIFNDDEIDEIEVVFSDDEDKNKKNEKDKDSLIEIDDNDSQSIPIPLQPPPQSPYSPPIENDVEIIQSPPHEIPVDVDIDDSNNDIYDLKYMNYGNEVDDITTIQNTKDNHLKPEKEKYDILDITDN